MPNKFRLEKDTEKIIDTQKMWKDFVESTGWKEAKKKLMEKIVANTSLLRITIPPNSSNEAMSRELTARALLGSLTIQMLTDVEGEASQYDYNMNLLQEGEDSEIMRFFPEKVDGQS